MQDAAQAPYWLQFVQPFATGLVGLGAFFIAYRQWRTAHDKLRLELLDRRAEAYNALADVLDHFDGHDTEGFNGYKLGAQARGAQLLFGKQFYRYLEEIEFCALKIGEIKQRAAYEKPLANDPDILLNCAIRIYDAFKKFGPRARRFLMFNS